VNSAPSPSQHMWRRLAGLAAVALVAVGLAACGGDEESSGGAQAASDGGSGKAEAQAQIKEFQKIPEFTLEADPVDVKSLKGKTIFNIPSSSSIPYAAAVGDQMAQIAEANGIKFVDFTTKGTPNDWARGIEQAINQKADLIFLTIGVEPKLVKPQLEAAKKAGIPVIPTHLYHDGGDPPPPDVKDLLAGWVPAPFEKAAALMADYAVANTDGEVNAMIVTSNEVQPSIGMVESAKAELERVCPDCPEPTVVNVPLAEWGAKLRPEMQSALTRDPNINWILPIYDAMALPADAAIKAAGRTGKVKIASFNGEPSALKMIQDGTNYVMDVGENINWLGYANMDQGFRAMAGQETLESQKTPLRVFDESIVDEAGTPPVGNKGYGDAYVEGYEKLWGLR
jgi:ribose transport system substrate-binding protein